MARVRAPRLRGRGWLNTGGREIDLVELRGKIVILDFWTFCCVNCLHVIDELRPIEERFGDVLVVIGVHSPKFEHERDPVAVRDAVERYGVDHPVLDDPDLITWDHYAAGAWPTLNVIDPEGYVVATMAGEGHGPELSRLIEELVEQHTAKGTLRRGDEPVAPGARRPTALAGLRFPGKALVLADGHLLVADTAQHSLVELNGDTMLRRIGDGTRGRSDDPPRFAEPGGLCRLPPEVAAAVGYDIVVADTANHRLRGLDLREGTITTVAGTGRQWRSSPDVGGALAVDLSSPWDVAWFDGRVIIAMAGIHQLWWFDPVAATAGVYAGQRVEALRDGPLDQAWLAQPSGLSVSPDGRTLWLVDAETSALRCVRDGELHTVVGQGLFDFGLEDGPAGRALLQHPLGVLALPSGEVLVADTFNGAVRRYDPVRDALSTVVSGLAEPSDLVRLASGEVVVVESAAHRLVPLAPAAILAPGPVALEVSFAVPTGQKLDDTFGSSTRLVVTAEPPSLLVAGAGTTTTLARTVELASDVEGGVLRVKAQAATCDAEAEHPACYLARDEWTIPITLSPTGLSHLSLSLLPLPTQDHHTRVW